MSNIEDCIK